MHSSTMLRMKWFFDNYRKYFTHSGQVIKVLDLGSYDVNGCYRGLLDDEFEYCGVDIEKGPNVDIVLKDVYKWNEIESNSFDIAISGQAFEHIEFPWLSIKEMARVLKPDGIMCIIAPHTAREHKYPYDCYRFYSDGLPALAKWVDVELLHSSIAGVPDYLVSEEWDDGSNDAMIIAKKKGSYTLSDTPQFNYERRIYDFEYKYRYRLMLKWLRYLNSKKYISVFLREKGYKNLAILATDEMANLFIEDVMSGSGKEKKLEVKSILTYKRKLINSEKVVYDISDLDEKIDAIIIVDPDYQKRVEKYLKEKMNIPILNIEFIVDTLLAQ